MKLTQKQVVIVAAGFILLVIIGIVVFFNIRKPNSAAQVNLTVWGTDSDAAMTGMLDAYQSANKGSNITYKQIDPAQYRTELLSALAAGTGPDVFEIGNRDLPQWQSVIAPLPQADATLFNDATLQADFPTVVGSDFADAQGDIYALPLSLDTLAMIYNKDLVDSAGIALLPKTWDAFDADIPKLRSINAQGQLTQAAAALGGSSASMPNATDILYLLMLQNGTQMTSRDFSSATFADNVNGGSGTGGSGANPGVAAFDFYLQFSNSNSPYYTWTDSMGDAEGSFVNGKTAVIFDYASALPDIRKKAPFLNVGVAPMPQPTGASVAVNYPSYEGLAVARYGQVAAAWNFIVNLTTNAYETGLYNEKTGTPPALRTAIAAGAGDPAMAVFGAQALTARSWHEADAAKIDAAMSGAVTSVMTGQSDSAKALQTAQEAVNAIIHQQSQ
ncbi:MAG TPA: extracellular solute-binding protein [Candidatus Paceibacterota bacterium]|nr:extracellular solute-binding protein [Candidatus Paceibacterota bacterium]